MSSVGYPKFLHAAADMHFDGAFMDLQVYGDHFVGCACAQKLENRKLTRRQVCTV